VKRPVNADDVSVFCLSPLMLPDSLCATRAARAKQLLAADVSV